MPPTESTESTEVRVRIFSHRFHRFTQNLLLRRTSHRLHRCIFRGCTCLRSALPLARARSAPTEQAAVLPQIARNSQNLLQRRASHRLHRSTQIRWVRKIVAEVSLPPQQQSDFHRLHRCNFRGCTCLKCTNQANSGPPTDCTEFTEPSAGDDLPQISQICTDSLGAKDPPTDCTDLHRTANFRGCTCLRSALPLARTRSAPTKQYRYTSCYVGALETSAPP